MEAKTLEQMAREWLAERYPDVTPTDYTIKRHADFARYSHSALVAACEKAANLIEHIDEHGHGQGGPRQLSRASLMRVVSELRLVPATDNKEPRDA